jgi:hypothetical protein
MPLLCRGTHRLAAFLPCIMIRPNHHRLLPALGQCYTSRPPLSSTILSAPPSSRVPHVPHPHTGPLLHSLTAARYKKNWWPPALGFPSAPRSSSNRTVQHPLPLTSCTTCSSQIVGGTSAPPGSKPKPPQSPLPVSSELVSSSPSLSVPPHLSLLCSSCRTTPERRTTTEAPPLLRHPPPRRRQGNPVSPCRLHLAWCAHR